MAILTWIGTTSTAWGTSTNWDGGAVPGVGDTAILDHNATKNVAGSDESGGGTLAAIIVKDSFSYYIGDATTPLKVPVTSLRIGEPSGSATSTSGSQRINIDLHSVQSTVTVFATASSAVESNLQPVRLKGSHASNVLNVIDGIVGVATNDDDDTATVATINQNGGTVTVASGTTLTTFNQDSGTANLFCAATTITQTGNGTVNTFGAGAYTTITVAGTLKPYSTGTITTLNVANGGTADFSVSPAARTVTNCNLDSDSTLRYNKASVTMTNGLTLVRCGLDDVTIEAGKTLTVTVA